MWKAKDRTRGLGETMEPDGGLGENDRSSGGKGGCGSEG